MARAISMRRTGPGADRDALRERARRARSHYTSAGCHYWIFEQAGAPGAFIEFFEAADPDTLVQAHRSAPEAVEPTAPLYLEMELS